MKFQVILFIMLEVYTIHSYMTASCTQYSAEAGVAVETDDIVRADKADKTGTSMTDETAGSEFR